MGGIDGNGIMTNYGNKSYVFPLVDIIYVLSDFSPTMILVGAIYVNKKAL